MNTHIHIYTGEKNKKERKNQMDNGLVIKKIVFGLLGKYLPFSRARKNIM